MQKKTTTYITIILLYLPVLFLALQIAALFTPEDTIFDLLQKYAQTTASDPLYISWNPEYSLKTIIVTTVLYLLITTCLLTTQKPTMPGREHGNSTWADITALNRRFEDKNESYNRIYSEHLRISMDPEKTGMNNNALVLGGSGTGKSFMLLTPNIYQANTETRYPGSFVFTDPKSELLRRNGEFLKSRGYTIKVLNLTTNGMASSNGYNPFEYIRSESDVSRLIRNIFANTTEKNTNKEGDFWIKAEAMFLEALFLFVLLDGERYGYRKNLNSVIDLLTLAEVPDEGERQKKVKSPLDKLFDRLIEDTKNRDDGGLRHPAYLKYRKAMIGATDTVRSIVITANARLSIFENKEVRRILEKDELELAKLGTDTHTALFCVIPDSDTTYNCIAGMLYTQLFQILYEIADAKGVDGRLPIPVTFWLDEFCNIAMPDNFLKLYTTMRSRDISAVLFVQSLSQLKALYDKEWETIEGNSDVEVYLGGNEESTMKSMSERTGKQTIWKRSQGKSYGRMGGSSTNADIIGRGLMLPEEVRMLKNSKCIVFVRGQLPVLDDKFQTKRTQEFKEAKKLGAYVHKRNGSAHKPQSITVEDCRRLSDAELNKLLDAHEPRTDTPEPGDYEQEIDISALTVEEVLHLPQFVLSDDELEEVLEGISAGLSDEEIKSYILCGDATVMRARRKMIEAFRKREQEAKSND